MSAITPEAAMQFEQTIEQAGIAIFPTDTLYGIACDPDSSEAAERIHELKGRPPKKPSAVMYFALEGLLADLGDSMDEQTRGLVENLLPGPYTLIIANPARRFAPACADTPEKLGIRVPELGSHIAALGEVAVPVMQTSANPSGGPDPTALEDVDPQILEGVDLALDGGVLLGYGSTVADVSELAEGRWHLLRAQLPRAAARVQQVIGHAPESEPVAAQTGE